MYVWYLLYFVIGLLLAVYSYVLVDPNLTLVNNPIWVWFREYMVQLGYFNRPLSTVLFLGFIFLFFIFQKKVLSLKKMPRPLYIALAISVPLIISYPFLSRDFFNYMFDAKIVTFYHQSPYIHKALDFPSDHWLRFMHWTHRTYPYGPTFLPLSLIPSFLSFGKLLLGLLFFKATWIFFYLSTVWVTQKNHKEFSLFFATSPLIIFEGLVNGHNDLIAICLTVFGMMALFKRGKIKGYIFLLLSVGIKYFTLPYILIREKNRKINSLVFWSFIIVFIFISITQEFQSWYLLNLVPLVLVMEEKKTIVTLLSLFALLAYYPYLAIGDWGNMEVIATKHIILVAGVILTVLIYVIQKSRLANNTSLK